MRFIVFDIETDDLLDDVTKLHCFCYSIYLDNSLIESGVFTTKQEIEQFFYREKILEGILIGHRILFYDLPVLKKLFNIEYKGKIWDTLGMSWDLYPEQKEHGLEYWGHRYNVPKVEVSDWINLTQGDYILRCNTDVVINSILFGDMYAYYNEIYFPEQPNKRIEYVMFKLECMLEQYNNPLTIDVEKVRFNLDKISTEIQERKAQLAKVMPQVPVYKTAKKPEKMLTIKGELTKIGEKWLELLDKEGYDLDSDVVEIQYIKEFKDPNPNSIPQIKNWLFSIGWIPTIYKTTVLKSGEFNKVPQLQNDDKEICPNILALSAKYEELEVLEGLFVLIHRQSIFEGMLENLVEDNKIRAEIGGFTNTMRFKHKKPICNLPSVDKIYGKEIRGSIIPENENYLFCGSDMSSLEDTTKQHYMYFYDPEYVKQMRVPGFDPHLDIALLAGFLNEQQVEDHKTGKANYKKERKLGKLVNFSGIYGAGPDKMSSSSGLSLDLTRILHKTYWERNKAVKQISKDAVYKSVRNQLWLWNPVAKMWYYLKNTKDIFSTLNQGTGVYCFDNWVYQVRKAGIIISLQIHDEVGFQFSKEQIELVKYKLQTAMVKTNEKLKLNVPLAISIDIGNNYAESH